MTIAALYVEADADRATLNDEDASGSENPEAPMHPTTLEKWDASAG